MANNNLYRKHEHGNKFPDKAPGYFDETGRIRALKLRGVKSEGIFLPLSSLDYIGVDLSNIVPGSQDFDTIGCGSH